MPSVRGQRAVAPAPLPRNGPRPLRRSLQGRRRPPVRCWSLPTRSRYASLWACTRPERPPAPRRPARGPRRALGSQPGGTRGGSASDPCRSQRVRGRGGRRGVRHEHPLHAAPIAPERLGGLPARGWRRWCVRQRTWPDHNQYAVGCYSFGKKMTADFDGAGMARMFRLETVATNLAFPQRTRTSRSSDRNRSVGWRAASSRSKRDEVRGSGGAGRVEADPHDISVGRDMYGANARRQLVDPPFRLESCKTLQPADWIGCLRALAGEPDLAGVDSRRWGTGTGTLIGRRACT